MPETSPSSSPLLAKDFKITTPRCTLRIPAPSDLPHVFSAAQHPGFTDGMLWEPPKTLEELQAPLEQSLAAWAQGTAFNFSIDTTTSSEFVGRIAIRKGTEPNVWDVGFWTHPSQQRKGFMREVLPAIVNLGFERLNAQRIEACHATWNTASQKVLESAGFTFLRHLPQGFQKRGAWVPENLLAVTKQQWLSAKSKS